jgi:hypothetical protein
MIVFINTSATICINYNHYSDIAELHTFKFTVADHSGSAVYGMKCLRSLERWDREFESHARRGRPYFVRIFRVCVVLYVCVGLATG